MTEQLGVHHEALRNWIRQDEADRGGRNDRPRMDMTEENRRLHGRKSNRRPPSSDAMATDVQIQHIVMPLPTFTVRRTRRTVYALPTIDCNGRLAEEAIVRMPLTTPRRLVEAMGARTPR
ncbi:transposase [Dactylosporangium sp. NPDC051484]|uniref:transposase n=1 Tax=Dactylosporangium sp. NPDC051484 TaxID=3154942 RepID=UPI00344E68E3